MIEELVSQGFEKNKLSVTSTSKRQKYGMPIYIKVNYNYKMDLPIVGSKIIQMNIDRESISKR